MRTVPGVGTPRSLQGRVVALIAGIVHVWTLIITRAIADAIRSTRISGIRWIPLTTTFAVNEGTLATDC